MKHDGTENRLSARQNRLIAALVANPDMQAACLSARVSRTTAYRWIKEPVFADALKLERGRVLDEALSRVKSHVTEAVDVLAALLANEDASTRRLACNDILRHAIKAKEMEDIQERLDVLERVLRERGLL
jgi:hypothetical protein